MNNNRRKEIAALDERLQAVVAELEALIGDIENVRDEEQDYFDNMPESIQAGERGDRASEVVAALDDAINELEGIDLDGVISYLDEARA